MSTMRLFVALLPLLMGFAPRPDLFDSARAPLPATEQTLIIGYSGQGRPISATRFGDGPLKLVVVGDTHGGPEANTYVLTNQLIDYFRANPGDVPPSLRLYLIPTLNPDGLALDTRFNGNGVDLNRNMNTNLDTCPENDWSTVVQGALGLIAETGGPYADSEPESRVIRSFLLDANGAIFIHSNAGLVFPAFCEHAPSIAMAQAYATGATYEYSRYWPNYLITGGMHDWAGSLGIAAITPELVTGEQSEFEQNLAGLKAVLTRADAILPVAQDRVEAGVTMPEPIWRYWKAHGGETRFGLPLGPAAQDQGVTRQVFTNAVLELRPDQADTPVLVQPAALGREAFSESESEEQQTGSCEQATVECRLVPETGHTVRGAFLRHWQRVDGNAVYGLPLSEPQTLITADGQERAVQRFERAVLAFYPEDESVRPEPLGWASLVQQGLDAPEQAFQLR